MRRSSSIFLGITSIALILVATAGLPVLIPPESSASSAVEPPVSTLWRPYGPYVQQVAVSICLSEFDCLIRLALGDLDWINTPFPRGGLPGIPDLCFHPDFTLVCSLTPEAGAFEIDINHHAPLFGIVQQKPRTDFTSIQDGRFDGVQSTTEPTEAGIHVRQAIAHLVDKSSFANSVCGTLCVAIDDQIPAAVCMEGVLPETDPQVEPCSTFTQRQGWDTLHNTCQAGASTPCAYRIAPGPGDGRPSNADLQAAREHLLAGGLKDTDGDGQLDWPGQRAIFVLRNEDPFRRALGAIVADALDSLFERGPNGEPVIQRIDCGLSILCTPIVFFLQPPDDWNLYTGGWNLGLDASHLYPTYDSAFATNFCGGRESLFSLNYGFHCNPRFDEPAERAVFSSLTIRGFNSAGRETVDIAGRTVMTIPVYSRTLRTAISSCWEGIVDVKGEGFAGSFNWFNMRRKASCPQTDTLRAGMSFGTQRLNIFHAQTRTEALILSAIYDSSGEANPRARTSPFFEQYETSIISLEEEFNTAGADQVPGNGDDEPVTVIRMIFRNDLLFHDGAQVTAEDFLKSGLAFRDVPMGGFGFASTWAALLSSSVPIPNSNCGNLCVQLVMKGQTFLHRLNVLESPILPLHLWDTNGDGFICSALGIGSCQGRAADPTTDVNFDPMAARIMVGHGPWMCLSPSGVPGGSCSRTAAGGVGGQSIGPGGGFLLTRFDGYVFCCPTETGTPLHRFSLADVNKDWRIDLTDFVLAAGNLSLQALIIASLDQKLGGELGKKLSDVDSTNNGNTYPVA